MHLLRSLENETELQILQDTVYKSFLYNVSQKFEISRVLTISSDTGRIKIHVTRDRVNEYAF